MGIKFDWACGKLRTVDNITSVTEVTVGNTYTHVNTFADLPAAASFSGEYRVVDTATGNVLLFNKKYSGFYVSNGSVWNYIGANVETSSLKVGSTTVVGAPIELSSTDSSIVFTPDNVNNKVNIDVNKAPIVKAITNIDSPYTVESSKDLILVDSTSAVISVILPTTGSKKSIKWIAGTHAVTITVASSGTIDGVSSFVIGTVNDCIDLINSASGVWRIV